MGEDGVFHKWCWETGRPQRKEDTEPSCCGVKSLLTVDQTLKGKDCATLRIKLGKVSQNLAVIS